MRLADRVKPLLSVTLVCVLATASARGAYSQDAASSQDASSTTPAPQSAQQIQALVAPVALYPDQLLAQVLSAATYPDQISDAETWLSHQSLTGQALMDQVNQQSWTWRSPLTAFQSESSRRWPNNLVRGRPAPGRGLPLPGHRRNAGCPGVASAGSGRWQPEIVVADDRGRAITEHHRLVEPVNPERRVRAGIQPGRPVYGTAYVVPGYTAGDMAAASMMSFGAGIAIGAMMSGACCHAWGWSSWNMSWHGGYVAYGGHP